MLCDLNPIVQTLNPRYQTCDYCLLWLPDPHAFSLRPEPKPFDLNFQIHASVP